LFFATLVVGKVVFFDDFDEFDLEIWHHRQSSLVHTNTSNYNGDFEWMTNNRSNTYVRDSVLYIHPTLTIDSFTTKRWAEAAVDNPIQSAEISTKHSFSFKYGKLETRAKLPAGNWIWPAIYLLPRYDAYGNWPASGEIDIMESRGNPPNYPPGGDNMFGSTLHWGPFWQQNKWALTHEEYMIPSGTLADDFHIYGLIWNKTNIITYIDEDTNIVLNVQVNESFWEKGGWENSTYNNPWQGRPPNAPFDQKYYILFDIAVGGTNGYFPDGYGKPWSNEDADALEEFWNAESEWLPTWHGENSALQIDYIKVSQ